MNTYMDNDNRSDRETDNWLLADEPAKVSRRKASRWHSSGAKARIAAIGALLMAGSFAAGTVVGSFSQSTVLAEETTEADDSGLDLSTDSDAYNGTLATTEMADSDGTSEGNTGLPDVSDVVASAMASVVSITNNIEVTTSSSSNSYLGRSGLSNSGASQQTQETEAYGSGVIIGQDDTDLLIATNNHVAVYDESGSTMFYSYSASTTSLTVTFVDGTEVDATLKGTNSEADLAVIAVALSDLSSDTLSQIKVATIGDSDSVKVGQGVIAIGNALGLGQSATIGYVSALNREVTTSDDGITRTLMQVDAAINGGNSGGGLFNDNGELIGINCSKYEDVGVEGIGFAIPINTAKDILTELAGETAKTVLSDSEKGYLGVTAQDVDSTAVSAYNYPSGAQVIYILEGSPADEAGLQLGDIITAVNGTTITSSADLVSQISYCAPEETVTLTVERYSGNHFEEISIDVTLISYDEIQTLSDSVNSTESTTAAE
ncbi:MAG: S1C family serine protease [Lachnospiraceae bacterium]|jgi:serine protease Do